MDLAASIYGMNPVDVLGWTEDQLDLLLKAAVKRGKLEKKAIDDARDK